MISQLLSTNILCQSKVVEMDVKRKFINIVSNYKNSLYTHMYVYIYVYTYTCVSKRPYRVS